MRLEVINGKVPSKSNSYGIANRGGIAMFYAKPPLKEYQKNFALECKLYRNANIDGLFYFYCKVYYPANRADLDNATKVILDCLQDMKAIKNDNNCIGIFMNKYKDMDNPRIEFIIKPLADGCDAEEIEFIKSLIPIRL